MRLFFGIGIFDCYLKLSACMANGISLPALPVVVP